MAQLHPVAKAVTMDPVAETTDPQVRDLPAHRAALDPRPAAATATTQPVLKPATDQPSTLNPLQLAALAIKDLQDLPDLKDHPETTEKMDTTVKTETMERMPNLRPLNPPKSASSAHPDPLDPKELQELKVLPDRKEVPVSHQKTEYQANKVNKVNPAQSAGPVVKVHVELTDNPDDLSPFPDLKVHQAQPVPLERKVKKANQVPTDKVSKVHPVCQETLDNPVAKDVQDLPDLLEPPEKLERRVLASTVLLLVLLPVTRNLQDDSGSILDFRIRESGLRIIVFATSFFLSSNFRRFQR